MTNFSIPQTRAIPPCRYKDIRPPTRKPKTRELSVAENARAYHNTNATARRTVDKPVPMPQATGLLAGSVVYLRWSAVPDEARPRMTQRRNTRGVVTLTNAIYSKVSWDGEAAERVPAEWLADAPEWI
jgi:hypothetical protein